ncbi:MAG: relaxase/mobilization nuclease domain-containing protein [Flavobacteriales bacterium]|nr:relaxase/mobilization nuclease domain-containing protein [Flavobacteriales bacterium]
MHCSLRSDALIVKSISHTSKGASIQKLVEYIWGSDKNLKDSENVSLSIKRNLRGNKQDWILQFQELEKRRISFYTGREVKFYHEVLSFSPLSSAHLDRQILKDLMKKYIEFRSETQILSCGTVHYDKTIHCHIIFSGIDLYGKSIRMSKKQFKEQVQNRIENYMLKKYPDLADSFIGYDKSSNVKTKSHKEEQLKKRTMCFTTKEKLAHHIQEIYIRSNSLKAFESNLHKEGIQAYHRNGKLTGVYHGKRKWRLVKTLGIDFGSLLVYGLKEKRLQKITQLRKNVEGSSLEQEI